MTQYQNLNPLRVARPMDRILSGNGLPPPTTTRWVASRKAEVVAAVESGLISLEQVMARYNLSSEEFAGWQRAMQRDGVSGLRVAAVQRDRTTRRERLNQPRSLKH